MTKKPASKATKPKRAAKTSSSGKKKTAAKPVEKRSEKPSPVRPVQIPRDFMSCLSAHVPGFDAEPPINQWGLAWMAWEATQKRRRHKYDPDAVFFTGKELDKLFGRQKYRSLQSRVPLFFRTNDWGEGATRRYAFTEEGEAALSAYRHAPVGPLTDLLQLKGDRIEVVRSLPPAICSTNTAGARINTSRWSFAQHTLNKVEVNVDKLQQLLGWLEEESGKLDAHPGVKHYLVRWYIDVVVKLLHMAHTTRTGSGVIAQSYMISPAGRLYGLGLNLQRVPALVRAAALHGMWEYDFANCHFSIISQMARRHGIPCPAIEYYMANKAKVRAEIATGAGITIEQAKRCLIALMYGAKATSWSEAAIPEVIGRDAAKALFALPAFKAISRELVQARRAILEQWPKTASGRLTNLAGKSIAASAKDAEKLAHLVQGVEAEALRVIVKQNASEIVLLQHDGFVSRRKLDCKSMEQAVFDQLGVKLDLEEEQLELTEDEELLSTE